MVQTSESQTFVAFVTCLGRSIDAIETREREVPEISEGGVGWRGPDEADESE